MQTWDASTQGKEKEFRLDSNDCGFICAGVNFVGGYKWHALFYFSCLYKLTTVWAPAKNCSLADSFQDPMA